MARRKERRFGRISALGAVQGACGEGLRKVGHRNTSESPLLLLIGPGAVVTGCPG
ncbi:hypothetical protein DW66_0124 [Pseudomonas putida]|nr:hypothetical protein DW66_0124 [Pseudomonas putida]AJG16745.1 hypothetical protein RK21_05237 [Pseudomonas plecoglossicida]